jgi:hypothetical protein
MRPSRAHEEMNAALEDVRRTIDRWFFWVSVTGVVYVAPSGGTLDLHDLTHMINRLKVICDDDFPSLIAFEFSASSFQTGQWDSAQALLQQFATNVKAAIRLLYEDSRAGTLIMLHRKVCRSSTNTTPVDPMDSDSEPI